jgi:hypothetical protein
LIEVVRKRKGQGIVKMDGEGWDRKGKKGKGKAVVYMERV